jgi:hypothetical protein
MNRIHLLLAFLFFSCFVGCMGSPISIQRWGGGTFGQGSVDRQKARAVYFDPFPLNDIGPPVVGGRPPGFSNPLPEAHRNKIDPADRFF